jgi:benzaldehyde dehydrogenase (NAD)
VLDDVDLDRAVSAGAWGSFLHQGQICMTTGRHLVHEAIYDDYVARLADKADTRWVTIRGDIAPYPF